MTAASATRQLPIQIRKIHLKRIATASRPLQQKLNAIQPHHHSRDVLRNPPLFIR